MTATCPIGHASTSDDYCDVCGMPIGSPGTVAAAPATALESATKGQLCPNCGTENVPDALFCEACGYDFTTGTMPRSAVPLTPPQGLPVAEATPPDGATEGPFDWVAEVWIDPAWYEVQESSDALPSAGLPGIVPLRRTSVLIGRKSRSRNIHPDIDCEPDSGTSRRQAQLTTDGARWWVEDLGSANGTFVAGASDPLPEDPIPVGAKRELKGDDRIYLGAWTRIVIREATEEERALLG